MAYATIKSGSKGNDTKTWQKYLKSQGYDIGSSGADGIFGAKTLAATKQYQKDKGLAVDGIVGKNTWASMNTGSNKDSTKGKTPTKTTPDIKGTDKSLVETATSSFKGSNELKGLETDKDTYKGNALDFLSNTNIIDQSVYDKLGEEWVVPDEVTQADAWLKEQLGKIQGGKTSWSDQYNSALNDYLNRDKFEYDVDKDQLFQQALASAMNSGKTAMQDTIGQASALTGGYGSTYATSAGNQAYNKFIEDAYNNLPEYYQMAMEAYQMEGQEMLNRVNMLGAADDKEYGRMVDAYGLTADHRNRLYDEAYSIFRDSKADALDFANLKLNENSTIAGNLTSAYDITSNEYENKYAKEYSDWNAQVENAWKTIDRQNSDYWSGISQSNWEKEFGLKEKEYKLSTGDTNGDGVLSKSERAAISTSSSKSGYTTKKDKDGNTVEYKIPTETQKNKALEAYNNGGETEYYKYLDSLPSNIDVEEIDAYVMGDGDSAGYGQLPYSQRTYTVTDDGGTNWFWGVDNNAKVKDQYGNEFTLEQLKEFDKELAKELSKKEYTKGKTYTKK
jgi:hypothetical protein